MTRLRRTTLVFLAGCLTAGVAGAQTLTIRNNYDVAYRGPIDLNVGLPDGRYLARASGRPAAHAHVRDGNAAAVVDLPARSAVVLQRVSDGAIPRAAGDELVAQPVPHGVRLLSDGETVADVAYDLVFIQDTTSSVDDAVRRFVPLDVSWTRRPDGRWIGTAWRDGHAVALSMAPASAGSVDFRARVTRRDTVSGFRGYLALIRRVATPAVGAASLRFNGRKFETPDSPEIWDRDFWYTHGVDWLAWQAGNRTLVAVNGFAPVPPVLRPWGWREASHFWVQEKTRRLGNAHFLVSQIAGPNKHQRASSPYAPLPAGDTVTLTWRLAAASEPAADLAESQLLGFAGPRFVTADSSGVTVDLGVRHVTFGVSYFPYSTLGENFDYYRTPGLHKEGFWSFSPALWARWRELVPRMRTDLHIIRAMGFERVRLHHLELLQKMDRSEALAFLDFFFGEARALSLPVLIDSEGPVEWLTLLASRYGTQVIGFELENEVLISGIQARGPARWKNLYTALKSVAPETEVFLTGVGNNGMYERLRTLGVPFDRVGLHAYKHGPQWKEAFASHVLGTASYASSLGMPVTLGEFNWKDLTKMSPPERMSHYTDVYEQVLGMRAIPDVFHFQFQESLSFNPSAAGTFSRHYETLRVDRRPKPEAFELMRLIRKYSAPSAPVNQLRISVSPLRLQAGAAVSKKSPNARAAAVPFSITNTSNRVQDVTLAPLAFDGIGASLETAPRVTLKPGETAAGSVRLTAPAAAMAGTYHHFLRASYDSGTVIGWGVASIEGAPAFDDNPVLAERVTYSQGAGSVTRLDWTRPLAVVFGGDATVLELETAYAITNTLQSATGKDVWLSSEGDLPDSLPASALVIVVGTPTSSILARQQAFDLPAGKGLIAVSRAAGGERLFLTGHDKAHAQAAAVDFLLRYWKNAKDSMIRVAGMERGAALGNRIPGIVVDPP